MKNWVVSRRVIREAFNERCNEFRGFILNNPRDDRGRLLSRDQIRWMKERFEELEKFALKELDRLVFIYPVWHDRVWGKSTYIIGDTSMKEMKIRCYNTAAMWMTDILREVRKGLVRGKEAQRETQ